MFFEYKENSYLRNVGKSSARTETKFRDAPRSPPPFRAWVVHKKRTIEHGIWTIASRWLLNIGQPSFVSSGIVVYYPKYSTQIPQISSLNPPEYCKYIYRSTSLGEYTTQRPCKKQHKDDILRGDYPNGNTYHEPTHNHERG